MVATAKMFPAAMWLNVGEIKTITATGLDDGVYNQSPTFTGYASADPTKASITTARTRGATIGLPGAAPPNLKEVLGVAAGDTTITASYSSAEAIPATVHVNNPAATPVANIAGGNLSRKMGQVVELDFEASTGVGWLNKLQLIDCDWGDGDHTKGLMSAAHAYSTAGVFTVTLTVTNNSGVTSQATITVTVTDFDAPTSSTTCTTEAQVVTAWNAATGGEEIVLDKSASWTTHIALPLKAHSTFVTIRSSGTMPARGVRIDPDSTELVTLGHEFVNENPLSFAFGQTYVRIIGIKFDTVTNGSDLGTYAGLAIPDVQGPAQSTAADNPSNFVIDHCAVKLPAGKYMARAIANNGHLISVNDSYFGGISDVSGQDVQAVWTLDGQGGHVYNNCYFEAAGENYLTGGSQNGIQGMTPKNIEFRRCHFTKDLTWMAYTNGGATHVANVKNIFETKNSRRMYVEGCILENHWDALRSQTYAIVTKTSVSSGSDFNPWAISEDIRFENSTIRHVYGGISSAVDYYGGGTFKGLNPHNIVFVNCLFADVSKSWSYNGAGTDSRVFLLTSLSQFILDHTTVIEDVTSNMTGYFNTNDLYGLTFKDSIFPLINATNEYGVFGDGVSAGMQSLNYGTGGTTGSSVAKDSDATWSWVKNVIPKYVPASYPNSGSDLNSYPANYAAVGFTNYQPDGSGDYSLAPATTYKNAASDGTDPGVNWTTLNSRTAATESGTGWLNSYPTTHSGRPSTRRQMFLG